MQTFKIHLWLAAGGLMSALLALILVMPLTQVTGLSENQGIQVALVVGLGASMVGAMGMNAVLALLSRDKKWHDDVWKASRWWYLAAIPTLIASYPILAAETVLLGVAGVGATFYLRFKLDKGQDENTRLSSKRGETNDRNPA